VAITIDATAGGSSSNSYITLADANTYWADLGAIWASKTDDEKKVALVLATRAIDRLEFMGLKMNTSVVGATDYQKLKWPRKSTNYWETWFAADEEGSTNRILPYSYNSSGVLIIPPEIAEACAIQANHILATNPRLSQVVDHIRLQKEGVASFSVPGLTETFSGDGASPFYFLAEEALAKLRKFVNSEVQVIRA